MPTIQKNFTFDHVKTSNCSLLAYYNVVTVFRNIIFAFFKSVPNRSYFFFVPARHKLRHIIHRAIKHAHGILRMPQGTLGNLVPVVVESLGEAFPEVARDAPRISQVLDMAEDRYLSMLKQGERSMATFLKRCPQDIRVLTGMFLDSWV